MSGKDERYDLTPKEREIIEWKHQRRLVLREEYLKRAHHPTKYRIMSDEGILRYSALKATYDHFFKPSMGNFMYAVGLVGSIVLLAKFLTYSQEKRERQYRSGQVAYADRSFKFQ